MNGYKGLLKSTMVFPKENNNCFVQKWEEINCAWCYEYYIKKEIFSK